ncbi:RNA polymerase sigma factor [Prevotella falsenii]|uniref:RNA polymerase sigma factor n=1 Tax=Prevotella falsenii TaxID=515414 RepID=UPI001E3A12B2|nr:RNA polymerase sigma factor [Prevotella falsenii]
MSDSSKKLNALIEENEPRLRRFVRSRVSNRDDANDIVQDTFFRLVKTVEMVETPIEQVSSWLFSVARNLIINKGKKKREVSLPETTYDDNDNVLSDFSDLLSADSDNIPDIAYLRSLVWAELDNALLELPDEQRTAFVLTEMEGLSSKEAAEKMGSTLNTFLSRKHYAVKAIRKRLHRLYTELIEE